VKFTDSGPRGLDGSALIDVTSEDAVAPELEDEQPAVADPDAELSRGGARRIYVALCVMAHIDGPPPPSQRRELAVYRDYLSLERREAAFLERRARAHPFLRIGRRQGELDLLLGALIDMAAADGRVSPDEELLLLRINTRARWSRERLKAAIARAEDRSRHVTPLRVA
jgi:hypothetical protein